MWWFCCRGRGKRAGRSHAEGHFRKATRQPKPTTTETIWTVHPMRPCGQTNKATSSDAAANNSTALLMAWFGMETSTLGGFNQRTKEFARCFIVVDRSLGVPLYGEDEMIERGSFQGFNNAVVGAASHDA